MLRSTRPTAGYTLIELITVVVVLSIIAAVALPMMNPSVHERLQALAQFVAADLTSARALAVVNNSKYRFTFDVANNQYYLEHTGTNAALNNLPKSPYSLATDPATRQTIKLATHEASGGTVRLHAVLSASLASVTQLEFRSFGDTTQTTTTSIWLTNGTGNVQRYVPITVNPVTGLAAIGSVTSVPPTSGGTSGGSGS